MISTDVKRRIAKIATHGKGDQFDDADVNWFLRRYEKKRGPGIEWLRSEYKNAMDYYDDESNADRGSVLFFFPVGKMRAKEILIDIKRRN